jgi:hypothetical protein
VERSEKMAIRGNEGNKKGRSPSIIFDTTRYNSSENPEEGCEKLILKYKIAKFVATCTRLLVTIKVKQRNWNEMWGFPCNWQ